MVAIRSVVALLISTAAASVVRRDLNTVLADFQSIGDQTDSLSTALQAFTGDLSTVSSIITAVQTLQAKITSSTADVNAIASASDSDQASLVGAAEALLPKVYNSLNIFVSKQSAFAQNGLGPTAATQLKGIADATDSFSAALVGKASGDYATAAKALVAEFDAAFSAAEAFSSLPATTAIPIPSPGGSGGSSAPATTPATSAPATSAASSAASSAVATQTSAAPYPTATVSSAAATTPAGTAPGSVYGGSSTTIPLSVYTGAAAMPTGMPLAAAAAMAIAAFAL